jgi:hypothetical protein
MHNIQNEQEACMHNQKIYKVGLAYSKDKFWFREWISFYNIHERFYLLPNCPRHSIQRERKEHFLARLSRGGGGGEGAHWEKLVGEVAAAQSGDRQQEVTDVGGGGSSGRWSRWPLAAAPHGRRQQKLGKATTAATNLHHTPLNPAMDVA